MVERIPEKTCRRCQLTKPLDHFHRKKGNKDGKSGICKPCDNHAAWRWKKNNPRAIRERKLRERYALTMEQYEALAAKQDYKCAICGATENKGKPNFAVDHCHESGEVRGLLCDSCNRGIGLLKDDPEVLIKAVAYLQGTHQ